MTKEELRQMIGLEESEKVSVWSELSWESKNEVARVLKENGIESAEDAITDFENAPETWHFTGVGYLIVEDDDEEDLQEFFEK